MALVLSLIASSMSFSSMFMVSGLMSTNTILAPLRTKAFTVDTKVKDGAIISSPSFISSNNAAISRAWVQDVVRRAFFAPDILSRILLHSMVNSPSPLSLPLSMTFLIY